MDDLTRVYKIKDLVDTASKAGEQAQNFQLTDAYSLFDACESDAINMANDEPHDLPDYLEAGSNDAQDVAMAVHELCSEGKTMANDPSPEHTDAMQKTTYQTAARVLSLFGDYEHAYVKAGGHASDWYQMFPSFAQ